MSRRINDIVYLVTLDVWSGQHIASPILRYYMEYEFIVKFLKIRICETFNVIILKFEQRGFQKYVAGKENCVDSDQTAPLGAFCSVPALFAKTYLSENLGTIRYFITFWTPNVSFHRNKCPGNCNSLIPWDMIYSDMRDTCFHDIFHD